MDRRVLDLVRLDLDLMVSELLVYKNSCSASWWVVAHLWSVVCVSVVVRKLESDVVCKVGFVQHENVHLSFLSKL